MNTSSRTRDLINQLDEAILAFRDDAARFRYELDRMRELAQEVRQDVYRLRQLRESNLSRRKVS